MRKVSILPGRIRLRDYKLKNRRMAQFIKLYTDQLFGVLNCQVNPRTGSILILFDQDKTDYAEIRKNLENAVQFADNTTDRELEKHLQKDVHYWELLQKRDKAMRSLIVFGLIYLLFKLKQGIYGKFFISKNPAIFQAAAAVTIVGGYPLLKGIYKKLFKRVPADSDIILKLTALSFTLMRESAKGVFVLLLKALNDYVRLSADVHSLKILRSTAVNPGGMAWYKAAGTEEPVLVPVEELEKGQIIVVHEGEVIPLKGKVMQGSALVNNLCYNGQAQVEEMKRGRLVYEGMSLVSGNLEISVQELPAKTDKPDLDLNDLEIKRRVSVYQEKTASIALGIAVFSFLFDRNIMHSFSILLVLTPSAAGVALSSGINNYVSLLSKREIYLRNPHVIENLLGIDEVVFDKTGTLTRGKMELVKVETFKEDLNENELLQICAACELDNYHPIGITLQEAVDANLIELAEHAVYLPGRGVMAQYNKKKLYIGNRSFMQRKNISIEKGNDQYSNYEKQYYTPVFVAMDEELAGLIVLQDKIRDKADQLIRSLQMREGIHISLLSGDESQKSKHIADKLSIKEVYSGCTPMQKERIIKMKKKQGTVMMVGDGINDIPAMRAADISVSFVPSAADKVKLGSDCIINEEDMLRLVELIDLSRASYRLIEQSIAFARLYNIIYGVLAVLSRLDAFSAKTINTLNSLYVLWLNMRIMYLKPQKTADNEASSRNCR